MSAPFELPSYARYAFEEVRRVHLEVWFENSTRWVRLDVLRDLVGNDSPYAVRVFTEGDTLGAPWRELEDGAYPWWRGATADEALSACLVGLGDRRPILEGLASRSKR
ncbi:MAG: hypothetical protein GY711_19385 [bacterium]|nr:hypothetical protein [bacterium]